MRLEHHDHPAALRRGAHGTQLRGDLRRVVGVVVVHPHVAGPALELEPPPHAAEGGDAVQQPGQRRAQLEPGEQRGDRVARHVLAGHRDPQLDLRAVQPDPRRPRRRLVRRWSSSVTSRSLPEAARP